MRIEIQYLAKIQEALSKKSSLHQITKKVVLLITIEKKDFGQLADTEALITKNKAQL